MTFSKHPSVYGPPVLPGYSWAPNCSKFHHPKRCSLFVVANIYWGGDWTADLFHTSLQNKNLQKTKIYHILSELNHLYLEIFWIFSSHSQYSPPVFTSPPAKTKTSIMSPLHSKIRQRPSKLALAWLGNEWIPRNMLEESQQIRVPLKPLLTREAFAHPSSYTNKS